MVKEIQFLEKGEFLDLGTWPGTQAIELAKNGFRVSKSNKANFKEKRYSFFEMYE